MGLDIVLVLIGILLLFVGGNYLLKSSVDLANRFNIPKLIIGMTIVSFATSAPELIVSINAAFKGTSEIALGNVIGSNIANIGLILGLITILSPIGIDKQFLKTDWPFAMLISISFYLVLLLTFGIERWAGATLFSMIIGFLVYLIKSKGKEKQENSSPNDDLNIINKVPLWLTSIILVLSGIALWLGSESLVNGATNMAKAFGVSNRVIAITVVAIGTSIPELAASLIAIVKKEKSIGLGNVIGSNIFNIGLVLGITAMLSPIPLNDKKFIEFDIYAMLFFLFLLLPMAILPLKKKKTFSRLEGAVLLLLYIVFIFWSSTN